MRRLLLCALCFGAALLAALPARAQPKERADLAWELSQLIEAVLHGDDAAALARLDAMRGDGRLRGELPRWVDALAAGLALQSGDAAAGMKALQPSLQSADGPRPYIRAARILLAFGETGRALEVIRQGRARDPYGSPALRRFEAGLLWLGGDMQAAQQAYVAMIADDARDEYPFVQPQYGEWSAVRPWNGPERPPAGAMPVPRMGDWDEDVPAAQAQGGWQPEPFVDLFVPDGWHPDDLPGLSRMIREMAATPDALARRRAAFPDLHKEAGKAQQALEAFRGGDAAQREKLRKQAVTLRAGAMIAARTCALADLAAGKAADAETILRMALELSATDTAALHLLAAALGAQGKAEEARTGPLSQLALQGLAVTGYWPGAQMQMADLVLTPALNLFKTDPEAGKKQLEAARDQFGPEYSQRRISNDAMGVWLYQKGQPQLALGYLREGARQTGYESGRPLTAGGIVLEHALLALGAGVGAGALDPAQPETPPSLLAAIPRAGLLLSTVTDSRQMIQRLAGISISGTAGGSANHLRAAGLLPEGDKRLRELLFGLHTRLATEAKPEEIDAILKADSTQSVALAEGLKTLEEALRQVKDNSNWRAHDTLRQRAGFIHGLVETRALLLRARLRQQAPRNMADLAAWLKDSQASIDLRLHLRAPPTEAAAKLVEEMAKEKIPEVFHSGLLLDAAKLLARGGDHAGAAKLLWLNRECALGADSRQRRLFVAAALARKAGDRLLEAQCRLAALDGGDPARGRAVDTGLLVLELPQLRGELDEFGMAGTLAEFVDACIANTADAALLAAAFKALPELKTERASMLMRNTLRDGMEVVFRASITQGSLFVIDQNWLKLTLTPDYHARSRRLALWVLASDLPFAGQGNGLCAAWDTAKGWMLMQQLEEARGAAASAARLKSLIQRCGYPAEPDTAGYEYDWWD